ncbi:MAG TPA: dienelactone hydrolase family protein [Thiolinea sp.]|nr:dienelactone hydrolase family protein [Thiolinea sp.]
MCDEKTEADNEAWRRRRGLTRRQFNTVVTGAALAALLPVTAFAAETTESEVTIPTQDGNADAYFVRPATGSHAAVIIWPDVMGIRPAFRMMGKRLAEAGYAVLVVNPYYRTAKGEVLAPGESYADPAVRERLAPHRNSLSVATCLSDGRAFVSWLDEQSSVDSSRMVGIAGYCMTGSYAIRLAAVIPERIGAGASFHGGGLVTQAEDSPHRLAPRIKAGLLIAIAENDDEKEPEAKTALREAFDSAGVNAEIEVYADTLHGWCPLDSRVYNEAQAEKAWARMLVLFERELA